MKLGLFMAILNVFHPGAGYLAKSMYAHAVLADVDPLLVAAVAYKESQFETDLCFHGAYGLMQVQTLSRKCGQNRELTDINTNVKIATDLMHYWRWYHNRMKHTGHHWLLHYNQGFGKCVDGGKKCHPNERQVITTGKIGGYADRVLKIYKRLLKIQRRLQNKQYVS